MSASVDIGRQQTMAMAPPRRVFPWLVVLLGAAFALVPYLADDVGLRESLLLAAVYITLASNLNLMIGYAGYINFGNIVFFGLGGYVCVYLVTQWHWPWSRRRSSPGSRSACSRWSSGSASCDCAARSLLWPRSGSTKPSSNSSPISSRGAARRASI
jgi:hypothetical protein